MVPAPRCRDPSPGPAFAKHQSQILHGINEGIKIDQT